MSYKSKFNRKEPVKLFNEDGNKQTYITIDLQPALKDQSRRNSNSTESPYDLKQLENEELSEFECYLLIREYLRKRRIPSFILVDHEAYKDLKE